MRCRVPTTPNAPPGRIRPSSSHAHRLRMDRRPGSMTTRRQHGSADPSGSMSACSATTWNSVPPLGPGPSGRPRGALVKPRADRVPASLGAQRWPCSVVCPGMTGMRCIVGELQALPATGFSVRPVARARASTSVIVRCRSLCSSSTGCCDRPAAASSPAPRGHSRHRARGGPLVAPRQRRGSPPTHAVGARPRRWGGRRTARLSADPTGPRSTIGRLDQPVIRGGRAGMAASARHRRSARGR